MPELPEVETVRRGLQPMLEGSIIASMEQRRADLRFPFPDRFCERLTGARIVALSRRAKYLLIHFHPTGSFSSQVLICHLGMSGSMRINHDNTFRSDQINYIKQAKNPLHDHVVFHLAGPSGTRLIYNDPRRFGFMLLTSEQSVNDHPMLANLGVEPTGNSLDGTLLSQLFYRRRAPLKTALLDQKLVAGLGNIYVCEALWRAKLSPRREAQTIAGPDGGPTPRAGRLAEAIVSVIGEAIDAGGSSLRDHVQADGSLGYFQHAFRTYDREGKACLRPSCNGQIRKFVQSGRSTFHCPVCQR